jgi:preprotein translocase SecE subunit
VSEAIDTVDNNKEGKGGVGQFVQETRAELDKVSYPSSDDVKATTLIVIINVIFFAVFLFLVDRGWTYTLEGFTWLVNKIAGI